MVDFLVSNKSSKSFSTKNFLSINLKQFDIFQYSIIFYPEWIDIYPILRIGIDSDNNRKTVMKCHSTFNCLFL